MEENYYQILGLNNFSSNEEIKRAYRQLAKKYHPDKPSGSEEKFKRMSLAYQTLSDPIRKERFDEWLKAESSRFIQTKYQRPKYTPRTAYYTAKKTQYTSKIKLYGAIFTILFLLIAISLPLWLSYKASNYHYQEGLKYAQKGRFYDATVSFNTAITWIGQRSGEASIEATRLSLEKLKNPQQAKIFIAKGIENTKNAMQLAELHYLKGKILTLESEREMALSEYLLAKELNFHEDSIAMELGQLEAFYFEEFEKGISYFDQVLVKNDQAEDAIFGKAWCLQKLNKPLQSLNIYNSLLELNSNHMLGNFYRGHNNIVLGDTASACSDFKKSYDLGYQPAALYLKEQCSNYFSPQH